MTSKIIICSACSGHGEYFYPGIKEPCTQTCDQCFGSGRMVEETTIVLKPYICK